MNLLTDDWLPVRLLHGGTTSWIGLSELLTTEHEYEICLPRDDLELAALQLVICITQVLFTPEDMPDLIKNIRKPMAEQAYLDGIKDFKDWFSVDHANHPFMQVRGVKASKKTAMNRLLPGLADGTNNCFVNEADIAKSLCGGCAALAIFNRATNSPSFGGGRDGGFKPGLRGSIPITTLIQGHHLRDTIWLNVLTQQNLDIILPKDNPILESMPTWVKPIKEKSTFSTATIGLMRGLFWQPALIELGCHKQNCSCSVCGRKNTQVFDYFLTNQFGYNIQGTWPHPHSPAFLEYKKKTENRYFASFKGSVPSWTQLARFVIKQSVGDNNKTGQEPAPVIMQANTLFQRNKDNITLIIGGYRNEPGKTASIAERRHETCMINRGCISSPQVIDEIVRIGIGYKTALSESLRILDEGLKDANNRRTHKGLGFSDKKKKKYFNNIGVNQFYRRTDLIMQKALAEAHFEEPERLAEDKDTLRAALKQHTKTIFEEQTRPYLNDPELIRTMAVARRTMNKHLRDLEPEGNGGEQ